MDPTITGINLGPLLGEDDDAEAQQKSARMVAALRDQQAQGIALKMTQNPMLAGIGGDVLKDAQAGLTSEDKYGPEAQLLRRMTAVYGLAGKLGAAQIGAGSREREGAANRASRERIAAMMAAARQQAAGMKPGALDPLQKQWYSWSQKYDTNLASGRNPLGLNQNLLNRIDRIQTLPASQQFMSPQDVTEFSMALANVLGGGGNGGQMAYRLIKEIKPDLASSDVANFMQWVTGHPQDAGARAFVKRFMATLSRERSQITEQNREAVKRGAIANADVIRAMGHVSVPWLKNSGLSDDDIEEVLGYAGGDDLNVGTAPVPAPTQRPARQPIPAPQPAPQPSPTPQPNLAPSPSSGGFDVQRIKAELERRKKEKSGG